MATYAVKNITGYLRLIILALLSIGFVTYIDRACHLSDHALLIIIAGLLLFWPAILLKSTEAMLFTAAEVIVKSVTAGVAEDPLTLQEDDTNGEVTGPVNFSTQPPPGIVPSGQQGDVA